MRVIVELDIVSISILVLGAPLTSDLECSFTYLTKSQMAHLDAQGCVVRAALRAAMSPDNHFYEADRPCRTVVADAEGGRTIANVQT